MFITRQYKLKIVENEQLRTQIKELQEQLDYMAVLQDQKLRLQSEVDNLQIVLKAKQELERE